MNPNILLIAGTTLIVAAIAAATALAFHGTIPGSDVVALIGTIVTLGGGALAVHTGVNAGANAATPPQAKDEPK